MSDKTDSSALVENMEVADEISTPDKSNHNKSGGDTSSTTDETYNDDSFLSLPLNIRRRVNALRKLQIDAVNIESDFYRKIHELECDYAMRMAPLCAKRKEIVNGVYEPTDEESQVTVPFDEKVLAEELKTQEAIKDDIPEIDKNYYAKGIPEFWLTAFRNSELMGSIVQYHDEPILKHLTDVEVVMSKDPMKFTFYFHFSPNEYFTNTVLTKEYTLKCVPDSDDPFSFEGPEVIGSKGCQIDWKPGQNATVKVETKMQKHKKKGISRVVKKEVKNESFFNFFNPPVVPESGENEMDEKMHVEVEIDYEIGQHLRDTLIPRAVYYYTGENKYDDDEFDDDVDEDEEPDEEDSDDEDDSENETMEK